MKQVVAYKQFYYNMRVNLVEHNTSKYFTNNIYEPENNKRHVEHLGFRSFNSGGN